MTTVFEVLCAHDDGGYARQAAQAGFELVDRLERELSRFLANSDISRINALGPGQAARVSPWTMECLEIAWRMHALTGGAFDISIGSGLERLELVADGFVVRAGRRGPAWTWGGSARATRWTAWRSSSTSGRSARPRPRGLQLGPGPRAAPRRATGGPSP